MKVFLDTNILLDILVERDNKEFTENAMTIVELGSRGAIDVSTIRHDNCLRIEKFARGPKERHHQGVDHHSKSVAVSP